MSGRAVISLAVVAALALGPVLAGCSAGGGPTPPPAAPTAPPRPECTQIKISASSEKAALLGTMANGYDLADRKVNGTCVDVRVTTLASGTAASALAADWDEAANGPRPDVWSPASSLWCGILEQRLHDTGRPALVPADTPSITRTPLVIAMPRPMAEALGWPNTPIGWADLKALADAGPNGWASRGHPEWGAFKLGKTNPTISTSGMAATVAAFHAQTDLSSDLTTDDIKNTQYRDFVSSIETSAVHYADTTLTFLQNLYDAAGRGQPMGYVSAVAVEEKSVWDYNQGNPSGDPATLGTQPPPKVQLVAIYPKEGTLFSDSPYVVLTASWVDDAKRAAAADFLAYVREKDQQDKFQAAGFRNFDGAPGPAITPQNGLLPDQQIREFRPPQPDVLNAIVAAWSELRKKANMIFVLDVSSSMRIPVDGEAGQTRMSLAKSAVNTSLDLLDDEDRVSLWDFSSKLGADTVPYRVLAPPALLGPARAGDKQLVNGLEPNGGTALYTTVRAAVRQLRDQYDPTRVNAVVVLTDGVNEYKDDDDLGRLTADLTSEDERSRIRVFPIAYGPDSDSAPLNAMAKATTTGNAYKATTDPASIDKALRNAVSNF